MMISPILKKDLIVMYKVTSEFIGQEMVGNTYSVNGFEYPLYATKQENYCLMNINSVILNKI